MKKDKDYSINFADVADAGDKIDDATYDRMAENGVFLNSHNGANVKDDALWARAMDEKAKFEAALERELAALDNEDEYAPLKEGFPIVQRVSTRSRSKSGSSNYAAIQTAAALKRELDQLYADIKKASGVAGRNAVFDQIRLKRHEIEMAKVKGGNTKFGVPSIDDLSASQIVGRLNVLYNAFEKNCKKDHEKAKSIFDQIEILEGRLKYIKNQSLNTRVSDVRPAKKKAAPSVDLIVAQENWSAANKPRNLIRKSVPTQYVVPVSAFGTVSPMHDAVEVINAQIKANDTLAVALVGAGLVGKVA